MICPECGTHDGRPGDGPMCLSCALLDAEAEAGYAWLCRYRGWPVKDGYARICLAGRLQEEMEALEVLQGRAG